MAKATILIKNDEGKKLLVAAKIAKVKLGQRTSIGTDASQIEVDYRDPEHLFIMGRLSKEVVGNEYDAFFAAEKAKADEKAKAAQPEAKKK